MNWVYIFIGGGLGSIVRHGFGLATLRLLPTSYPLGTFISNVTACLILGLLVYGMSGKMQQYNWIQPLLLIGFCGGFSTFSTFSNETVQLLTGGNYLIATLNIFLSLGAGIGVVYFLSTSTK
jgi:CrcB protein